MELVERVEDFLQEKANKIAENFYNYMFRELKKLATEPEAPMSSPVEQLLFIEWLSEEYASREFCFNLKPQFQDKSTGKYRLDFKVGFIESAMNTMNIDPKDGFPEKMLIRIPEPKLGIEIDSHQWHEKTKEQARRDKERERFLISKGWKLLRFTGSEVYENPNDCLEEIDSLAIDVGWDFYSKLKKYQEIKEK